MVLAAESVLDPMVPVPHRVVDVVHETGDVVSLALEACAPEHALVPARPGQFNMCWSFGVGEVPISVSEVRVDRGTLVHTVRAVGPVTRALCRARPGDVIGLRGPFGTGWDVEDAVGDDVVVVAGGIGLAPLRLAIEALLTRRAEYGRVAIVVGARAPQDLVFRSALDAWRAHAETQVEVTVDTGDSTWTGHVGVVTELMPQLDLDPARTTALLCGPEVMIRFAARALQDGGVGAGAIRVSLERNMECGIGQCGHCQLGPRLLCRDGPVVRWSDVVTDLLVRER